MKVITVSQLRTVTPGWCFFYNSYMELLTDHTTTFLFDRYMEECTVDGYCVWPCAEWLVANNYAKLIKTVDLPPVKAMGSTTNPTFCGPIEVDEAIVAKLATEV